jgi:hypothetical protein
MKISGILIKAYINSNLFSCSFLEESGLVMVSHLWAQSVSLLKKVIKPITITIAADKKA